MNLLLFQNCISPHQMPYIKELKSFDGVDDVMVVAPVANLSDRKEMGWNVCWGQDDGVAVYVSPSDSEVQTILSQYDGRDTWCFFSGIRAFPEVFRWFKMSIGKAVKRGIITEPPYLYAHPLWQHAIRFAIKDLKYVGYFDKVFVMGDEYLSYYKFWNRKWSVVPFMYCTEWKDRLIGAPPVEQLRILYVGALSKRKNVSVLLEAVRLLENDLQTQVEIGIIGDGDEREMLEEKAHEVHSHSVTTFYGCQHMEDVCQIMQQYDVLVLPSLYDGWGAVVNEALILGLYVVCSDRCGAKFLLKDAQQGMVFRTHSPASLKSVLRECVKKKSWIRDTIHSRIEWAKVHISGKAVAKYFLENLE